MNIRQAQSLKPGDMIHYTGGGDCGSKTPTRSTGTRVVVRYRVTGQPQTWKRTPSKVRVPVKHGLYTHGHINETNLKDWHLESECPLIKEVAGSEEDVQLEFADHDSGEPVPSDPEHDYVIAVNPRESLDFTSAKEPRHNIFRARLTAEQITWIANRGLLDSPNIQGNCQNVAKIYKLHKSTGKEAILMVFPESERAKLSQLLAEWVLDI